MDSVVNKGTLTRLLAVRNIPAVEELNCGSGGGAEDDLALRIAAIFIILAGGTLGAIAPIVARKWTVLAVPEIVFDFVKYFGSGVIFSTAFIHLLFPAVDALGSECLGKSWHAYPYGLALCMVSIFMMFLVELIASRWGAAKLAAAGGMGDAQGQESGVAYQAETVDIESPPSPQSPSIKHFDWRQDESGVTQIIALAILDFGIVFHSVIIGLALAVADNLVILLVVIVFHQLFEGLGLGSRLADLVVPKKFRYVSMLGAILYGISTPIGMAAGLGVRSTYNPWSTTALIVTGVLDSISAGILIYASLVELIAHDFLYNKEMQSASTAYVVFVVGSFALGTGIMSLVGKWA